MNIIEALDIALRLVRFYGNTAHDNAVFMEGSRHELHFIQEDQKYTEAVRLLEEDKRQHALCDTGAEGE
jgi:hypothetical protein